MSERNLYGMPRRNFYEQTKISWSLAEPSRPSELPAPRPRGIRGKGLRSWLKNPALFCSLFPPRLIWSKVNSWSCFLSCDTKPPIVPFSTLSTSGVGGREEGRKREDKHKEILTKQNAALWKTKALNLLISNTELFLYLPCRPPPKSFTVGGGVGEGEGEARKRSDWWPDPLDIPKQLRSDLNPFKTKFGKNEQSMISL